MLGAEVAQQFVLLGASYLRLTNFGGIAFHLDSMAWLGHNIGLRKVGVEQREHCGGRQFALVSKLAVGDAYGVDAVECAVLAVHVELGIVYATEGAFDAHAVLGGATGSKEQQGHDW